jgi:two-component system CheB/CheR fusion protein
MMTTSFDQGSGDAPASRPPSPPALHPRDRLLATVSHELRQPLSLIQMHADQLTRLSVAIEYPAVARVGDMIKRAVQSQGRIIDDLLDLSRVRTGKLVLDRGAVDLGDVFSMLAAVFRSEASGRLPVIELAVAGTATCFGDRTRIEQVLGNLLRNAIRFTPLHGCIRIDVGRDGAFCKASVSDTGCGISPDFLPHVFDMFNQEVLHSGPSDGGLGIGLALVRELAEAHGGRVEALSDGPGHGARFNVWLPAFDESSIAAATSVALGAIVPADEARDTP